MQITDAEYLRGVGSMLRGTTDEPMDATVGGAIADQIKNRLDAIADRIESGEATV